MNGQLDPSDYTGMSFWIISAAMVAATFFFWVERDRAVGKWKTSLTVAAMVTGIAAIHYFYMRGVWASTGESPLVFRYVDWLLTVPLQIVEFYLILAAIPVTIAATVKDVFHLPTALSLSTQKKKVAATIAAEIIQKLIPV